MPDSAPRPVSAQEVVEMYPQLGIPHFQRGLVWNEDAVALLLESLYWHTPCGNIILWRPIEPAKNGQPLNGSSCEYLIVDGQQRIRMLHEAIASPIDVETETDESTPDADAALPMM